MRRLLPVTLARWCAASLLIMAPQLVKAELSAQQAKRVESLLAQGKAAFRDGLADEALQYYREIEQIGEVPGEMHAINYNMGRILARLERYEEARSYFGKALALGRDPKFRRQVEGRIAEMDRLSHGDLDVACQPQGVYLELVDERGGRVRQGTCPIVWATLPRGEYTIEAILPAEPPDPTRRWVDDRRRSVTAEVVGGRRNTSDIAWASQITIDFAPPRSRISIDDRLVTGRGPHPVEPGEHTIRIEAPGRPPWSTTKIPAAGERVGVRLPDAAPSASSPSIEPESRLAPWLFGAGAVLAATAGGVFGAVTHQRYSDAEARYRKGYPGCCEPSDVKAAREDTEDLKSQGETFEAIAWTSGGLALALGGIALYLALDADDSPAITPHIDPTSAAVQWSFSW